MTGGGKVKPSPTVKIPGAFHSTDPGYVANIYNNFKSYTVPGGEVVRDNPFLSRPLWCYSTNVGQLSLTLSQWKGC